MTTRSASLTDVVVPRLVANPAVVRLSDRVHQMTAGISVPGDSVLRQGLLGHGVHPVLTDLPLGCWTSASIVDLFGGPGARDAATVLLTIGVASAVPTAVTGFADWTALSGEDRRIGIVHAVGNDLAIATFTASLVARRKGRHRLGVGLALLGNGLTAAAGFLGGHLALNRATASPAH